MEYKFSTKHFYSPNTIIGIEPDTEEEIINPDNNKQFAFTIPNFPTELLDFYKTKPHDREIFLETGWRLLSLEGIVKRYKIMQQDNINIIDIGLKYLGMGYVKVAAYNLTNNYYFYREDGGSSDVDRSYNYNNLKFNSDRLYTLDTFNFEEFLNQIHGTLPETKMLF